MSETDENSTYEVLDIATEARERGAVEILPTKARAKAPVRKTTRRKAR